MLQKVLAQNVLCVFIMHQAIKYYLRKHEWGQPSVSKMSRAQTYFPHPIIPPI